MSRRSGGREWTGQHVLIRVPCDQRRWTSSVKSLEKIMEIVTLTLGEVADMLKVNGLTVRRMWARGQFPAPVNLGRIIRWRAADVEKWLAEQPTSTLYEQKVEK